MYPIKLSAKSEAIAIITIITAFAFGLYFHSHLPVKVVTHWNITGEPDAYGGRTGASFGIPSLLAGIYILFLAIPLLDPKKERYQEFSKVYHFFKTAIMLVLLGVFLSMGYFNLGYNIKIGVVIPVLLGLLFIGMGNYMGKIKNNWFMGIRTPWTLSSENVWNKTHRFGGVTMMLFGMLLCVTPFLPTKLSPAVFIFGVVFFILAPMAYSYALYQKEKKNTAADKQA